MPLDLEQRRTVQFGKFSGDSGPASDESGPISTTETIYRTILLAMN